MLSQAFSIIIDRGISALGYGREVVDGLNAISKRFLLQLIPTLKLPGANSYVTQMVMHTRTHSYYVSFYIEFQKYLSNAASKHGVIYHVK